MIRENGIADLVPARSGIAAVLDAADTALATLQDAQYVASFAPPITSYRSCVCGAVMEKRGTDQITHLTADEKTAAAAAVIEMLGRSAGRIALDGTAVRIVNRVQITAVKRRRR